MYTILTYNITRFFFLMFVISQLGNFHVHYKTRLRSYERAQTYLKTELCTNPRVKASLGEYNLCSQSEETLDNPPLFTAIVDTAEDIHICGNGYCSMLGVNITNSLPQVILTLAIIAVILLWASGVSLRKSRERQESAYWSLPQQKKED